MLTMIKCINCGKEIEYKDIDKYNWIVSHTNNVFCPRCIISMNAKYNAKIKAKREREENVKNINK